jgi:hypothetical protein
VRHLRRSHHPHRSAAGGELRVAVTTQEFCAWTAVSRVSWIVITSSGNGIGTSDIIIRATANTDPARSGTIDIGSSSVVVSQDAAPQGCTYVIAPSTLSASAAGESATVAVTAIASCAWAAISEDAWITVRSGASGSGNGSVTLDVLSNSGPTRTGRVTIAGRTFTVTQAAAGSACAYAINPTSLSPTAAGGSSTVAVTTTAGCTWTTSGAPGWITVTGGSGTGNGSVTLAVAANTGAARTATLTIAGQSFALTQAAAGACAYALNPTSLTPTAAGGSSTVAVTTTAGCTWTTTGAPAWITVTGGSGTGNGSVTLAVAANTGAARTATLTIAGQSFALTQAAAGACVYALNPTSLSPTAAGGTSTVAVTTTAGCTWTTTGKPAWITVTGGSGTGNGSVTLAVAANTGAARTATLTIAGQPFTVTQAAAACLFTVTPTSIQVSDANTTKKVNVTTASYCSWTASVTSGSSWLTITSASSDTGNGTVDISIAQNLGAARTGTLSIAGKVVTINQDPK